MPVIECLHFNGYKPCGLNEVCDSNCPQLQRTQSRILIVHLGALGAVLRSTALLSMIHQKYPRAHVTWVTQKPAHELLKNNSMIHRVLTTESSDLLKIRPPHFDVAFVIDKSLEAAGVLSHVTVDLIFGFQVDARSGAILPATKAANNLWNIGLSNHLKFHINRRTELELIAEALELGFDSQRPATYNAPLSAAESEEKQARRKRWSADGSRQILGLSTGCGNVIAAKKLTIEFHRRLIQKFRDRDDVQIVLLGGPEDSQRNSSIAEGFGNDVISSETESGLRDGLVSVAACDVVLTGDSLGMHMAISQQVQLVAWFGPTCAHEIEFYGLADVIQSAAHCAPCWKRSCQKDLMCYDQVDINEVEKFLNRRLSLCLNPPKLQKSLDQNLLELT